MKKRVLNLLTQVFSLIGKIYTYSIFKRLDHILDIMYTMWIRNFIGYTGENIVIERPCRLQGGGQASISIGNNTNICGNSILGCWINYGSQHFTPYLSIGDNCNIGEYNHISACKKITIGEGVLTGRFVYIGDNNHGGLSWVEADIPPIRRKLKTKGEIVIGNNVWIGDKVTILSGVRIGDNVIVAANSVVTKDIRSNCIVAGNPAKEIKRIEEQ